MNLWIYTSKAPKNLVSKDTTNPDDDDRAYLYTRFGLTGQLMENTSLTDPVIEIELYKGMRVYDGTIGLYHTNTDFDELRNVINKCNYINLADLEVYHQGNDIATRCCFINEIEFGNYYEERDAQGNITVARLIVRLYCHVDVLMTYRYTIKSTTRALVVAQQGASGGDLLYNTQSLATTIPETVIIDSNDSTAFSGLSVVLLTVGNPDASV